MQRRTVVRGALTAGFVVAGTLHFLRPDIYLTIMPPYLPQPLDLVYISGAGEIVGGVGLLLPPARRAASYGLIALLIAVFPANVQMLLNNMSQDAPWWTVSLLIARLPLQPVLIVLVYLAGRDAAASDKPAKLSGN